MNTPVYGQKLKDNNAYFQTLKVTASIIPDMKVNISEGSAFINRKLVEFAGGTSATLAVPTVSSYIAVIGLKGNNSVILYGDIADNNPALPEIPSDVLPLAAIVLRSSDTVITSDMIQDIRPLFSATTFIEDHDELENRDAKNAHPISAITDLQEALDAKLSAQDLDEQLATKAGLNGTSATTFTLNANSAGVPTSDIILEFKRGAMNSAAIRFNEETDHLEFTDDGTTWTPLDTTLKVDPWNQENYYTKAQVDVKVGALESAVADKADADEVAAIKKATNDMATKTYVNNQFLNLYSKQDLDNIVAQMKLGLASINTKADSQEVYSKTEADAIHADTKAEVDATFEEVNGRIDALTEKVDEVDPKLESMANSVDTQLANTREEVNTAMENAVKSVEDIRERLNRKVDDGLARVDERITQAEATSVAVIAETIGRLDTKFETAINDISTKYANIEETFEADKEATAQTVAGLTEKVETAETTVNQNADNIALLQESLMQTDEKVSEVEEKVEQAQLNIEDLQNDNVTRDERITSIEDTVAANKEEAEQALTSAVETINTTIDEKEAAINEKITEVNEALTEAVETINNTISEKETAVNEKIDTIKEELEAKDVTIETSIEELTNTVNDKEDSLIARIVNAKTELQTAIDATKEELETAISDASETITDAYTTADQSIIEDINEKLDLKADKTDAATKLELAEAIENVDITDNVYTKSEIDDMVSGKANISDVYQYTQAQIDNTLSNKQEVLGYTPEDSANKNVANGYAGLDANGKVSINQLPDNARQKTYVVANAAERTALTDLISGDRAFETGSGDSYIYNGTSWILTAAAKWENVNIDFANIIGKPDTLAGYGITDGVSEASVDTKLEGKANKDHTHEAAEVTTSDERMFITKTKLEEIDAKANSADVYSKSVADLTFVTKDDFNTTLADYTTNNDVDTAIDTKIADAQSDYYTKSDISSLLADKVDVTDDTVARVANVDEKIATAKSELTTEIDKKANSDDVYEKTETYTKAETEDAIDAAVDAGIEGALQSVNAAINEALGNNSGSGSALNDIATTVESTKELIKQLSKDKDDKITEVESKIIEQVVTKENIVNIVKNETSIDLTALAKQDDVTAQISDAVAPLTQSIEDIQSDVSDKVDASEFETLSNKVDGIDTELGTVKTNAQATADSLAEYITVIGTKTTMSEVEDKLANYTTTEAMNELLDAKATQNDINTALENYMLTSDINDALAEKASKDDVANSLSAYTTTEDLTTLLAAKADTEGLIQNGVLNNKVMVKNKTGYENSYTQIFNELNSGGGSLVYNSSDNTTSYVGTNLSSSSDKVQVQIYAKHKDTNIGTRLNVNTDLGMFYLKGTTNADPWNADREVAVLGDIKALKTELEAKIQTLQDALDALDVSTLSSDVEDLKTRVSVLENL